MSRADDPDDFDRLLSKAAKRSRNKHSLLIRTERGRQFEKSRGYIPLDAILQDEKALKRNLEIEERSAHGDPEFIRAIKAAIESNAAAREVSTANHSKGGRTAARTHKSVVVAKHGEVVRYAHELLAKGRKPHELASIIAEQSKKPESSFQYSPHRVRTILQKAGVIAEKRKSDLER
jgi:hypothetical protein